MPPSPDLWYGSHSLARRIELGAERESLLQVLDEDAHFGGQPAAGRPNRKDRHSSFEGSQKTDDSAFPEFCGEEPCRRLGNPQVFKDPHPHLFNVAGTKDSCRNNPLRFLSGAKAPRPDGAPFDQNDGPKAVQIAWRFRCAVSREVLRSGDENNHRLRESSSNESGVGKFP